jgi:hypothetical protein
MFGQGRGVAQGGAGDSGWDGAPGRRTGLSMVWSGDLFEDGEDSHMWGKTLGLRLGSGRRKTSRSRAWPGRVVVVVVAIRQPTRFRGGASMMESAQENVGEGENLAII